MTSTNLFMTLASIIWGFQPSTVKWLTQVWSPATITTARYGILSLIIFAWVLGKHLPHRRPRGKDWPILALMGLCAVTLNNTLQFTGLQYTSITNCTLISATSPALTGFLAAIFLKERLKRLAWLGIFLSFAGVLLVVTNGSLQVLLNINFNQGDLLCFASQTAWAVYSILGIGIMKHLSPIATTAWSGLFGTIFTAIYALQTETLNLTPLSTKPLLSFLYLTLLGGVLAQVIWNVAAKKTGPSQTSIFLNIIPVAGMLTGYLLFDEAITFTQLGGALAIFSGVYLTTHSRQVGQQLEHWLHLRHN